MTAWRKYMAIMKTIVSIPFCRVDVNENNDYISWQNKKVDKILQRKRRGKNQVNTF